MWKKLSLLLFACAFFLGGPAAAAWAQQTGTVEGRVTDAESGDPLPGVNVVLQDTQVGTATNVDGQYTLDNVDPGAYTLEASFLGYETYTQEVDVAAGETVTAPIPLREGAVELEAVSVTALGFRENRDELATSTSSVSGDQIANSGATSPLEALSGKAAGLNINKFGGDPGAGSRITIRGQTTISGSNQPLIVVDGVPISNETVGQGTAGTQQQSRLNDLNPEDIASVEVLKGASAGALWGSRAQSGVVLIETKSGSARDRINVTYKASVGIDRPNQQVPLQNEYGQGSLGGYRYGSSLSWGDYIPGRAGGENMFVTERGQFFSGLDTEGELVEENDLYRGAARGVQTGETYYAVPSAGAYTAAGEQLGPHGGQQSRETFDQSDEVFENGSLIENNLSVSGGGEDGTFYVSLANTTQDGIIVANSNYERTSARLNAERYISDQMTISAIANYTRVASDRVQQGSNISGLMLGALRTSPDFNGQDYTVDYYPTGLEGSVVEGKQRAYRNPIGTANVSVYDNPLWTANQVRNASLVNRILGKVAFEYDPIDWVNLTARVGLDTYNDRRRGFFPVYASEAPNGSLFEQDLGEYELTADLIGRISRNITENIGGTLTLGTQLSHEEYDEIDTDLDNFSNPIDLRSLENAEVTNVTAETDQITQRRVGVFGEADLDFYDQLFVKLTGRLDQASAFGPEAESSFFYPSASVAWQFIDLLPENDVLSFGKLRVNYGQVGREPSPYLGFTYFNSDPFTDGYTAETLAPSAYGGGFQRSAVQASPGVIPERTTEFEVGTDLRFFNDRLSLNATYYDNVSESLIFDVAVSPSTGFLEQTQNAAEMENWGVELSLDATWISGGDFGWDTYANWSTNQNTVTDLAGVQEVALEGFTSMTSSLVEGEPFGVLYGSRWRRAPDGCDPAGLDLDVNCEPLTDQEMEEGYTVGPESRVLDPFGFPVEAATDGINGNPNPDWSAGLGNTFRYKGVSLDFLFDVKSGGDIWNGTKGALYNFGRYGDQDWRTTLSADEAAELQTYNSSREGDGLSLAEAVDQGVYPSYYENDDGSYTVRGYVEDFGGGPVLVDETYFYNGPGGGFTGPGEQFVEDGSFVRLRELTLAYNWQGGLVERVGLQSVDVSLTGRNLLLFTDYGGIDPETNLTGPSNGQGLDYFNNPNTRSYRFTLRLNY